MGYSEAKVLIGGLAHIPVVIGLFGLVDRRTRKGYLEQKASLAKAKALAKAQAKIEAEKRAAEAERKASEEVALKAEGTNNEEMKTEES